MMGLPGCQDEISTTIYQSDDREKGAAESCLTRSCYTKKITLPNGKVVMEKRSLHPFI